MENNISAWQEVFLYFTLWVCLVVIVVRLFSKTDDNNEDNT